ncbi:hypothetical protein FB567DRAFT_515539 [Paraphoma chrysanthemicola]|uniref:PAT1 multi-domain protein n=1 Tax=Paraphoma chrysanthemicola TaxID=798071 RepID=A0A8K0W382_9PLEO|nr:hypothetical protein FB567DRAFT_515539 [Paraphoma chrysanthemicola]
MIFGGLEIVAGGYLVHRHYKHKNEKKRREDEVEARRHNTFPGAKPAGHRQQAPQYRPQPCQQPVVPQQKYACYGSAAPLPQQHYQQPHPAQPYAQPRPQPPRHAQTFNIPRRPVPERKPQIIIQPSLQRTDSFATLSRMPIANGSRPQNLPEEVSPVLPPRRHDSGGLQPATQHGIYGNAGFSVSTPAFGATPTSPGLTYTMATGDQHAYGGHSTDDNWETYGHVGHGRPHYAPTEASTQLGEQDPPPPYVP